MKSRSGPGRPGGHNPIKISYFTKHILAGGVKVQETQYLFNSGWFKFFKK